MTQIDHEQITTPDGRVLDVVVEGSDGIPLVFHNGTPNGAVPYAPLTDAAVARGLRVVSWSRPGYGRSTVQPGRTVADVVRDTEQVLELLDGSTFVTLGWSGGGPHALACAALLPDRCLAAATMGGLAPRDAAGLDWLGDMEPAGQAEFTAAMAGEEEMSTFAAAVTEGMDGVTGDGIVNGLTGVVDKVDIAALNDELAGWLAACLREAVVTGSAGWRDDSLAFVRPWGFDVTDTRVPITVWHGRRDRMVPVSHGEWLATAIPNAQARLLADEGHLSLAARFGDILDGLVARAG